MKKSSSVGAICQRRSRGIKSLEKQFKERSKSQLFEFFCIFDYPKARISNKRQQNPHFCSPDMVVFKDTLVFQDLLAGRRLKNSRFNKVNKDDKEDEEEEASSFSSENDEFDQEEEDDETILLEDELFEQLTYHPESEIKPGEKYNYCLSIIHIIEKKAPSKISKVYVSPEKIIEEQMKTIENLYDDGVEMIIMIKTITGNFFVFYTETYSRHVHHPDFFSCCIRKKSTIDVFFRNISQQYQISRDDILFDDEGKPLLRVF